MGGACARDPSRLCSQQLRQAGSCRIQEEPESSSRLRRLVDLPPSEAQGGVRACVCVYVCVCESECACESLRVCLHVCVWGGGEERGIGVT